ncbi:MAG: DMT family transporter [Ruminococcaceae bacterium]|nr:DMT family transporter [Oscillospiraceae bacterium]
MKKLPPRAIFAAIFCNILFGSAFPMIKLGYEYFGISDDVFSKILYAGIRFFIAGIIVFIIDSVRNKKIAAIAKPNIKNVILLGVTYTFLQYIFFYVGLSNTTGASGSVVNSASVFFAIILAHFIYPDDKLNFKKFVGCAVGFAGVALACFAGGEFSGIGFSGEGFILIAGMFFVIGSVINKKASKINGSFTVTAYNLLIGGFLLIITGLLGYNGEITVTPLGILVLFYLVLVSSVGVAVWSSLLKNYPIGKISVYNFIIPVSGTLLSGLFLKENILIWEYAAALLLVSVGIFCVNYIPNRK